VSEQRHAARLDGRDPGGLSLRWLIAGPITSSLARCFEHGRFKRLARARAGPGHKLERRVVALACVEGGGQVHLALSARRLGATGKHEYDETRPVYLWARTRNVRPTSAR
jgi:hypothetical protein